VAWALSEKMVDNQLGPDDDQNTIPEHERRLMQPTSAICIQEWYARSRRIVRCAMFGTIETL